MLKHRLTTALCWSLLLDAVVLASMALLTTLKWPVWMPWMGSFWPAGMVVPEISLWLVPLALCFGGGAWFLRRGQRAITTATLSLCAAALLLLLKPTFQAWWLGLALPAKLAEAFGPADPQRPPFSIIAAMIPQTPERAGIETMDYSGSLKLDFYRSARRDPVPCVIVVHGGSWVSGNRLDEGTKRWLNDWLVAQGYAVASIDYRLAPEFIWPAQRDDLLAAIAFLRAHAAGLGIDATRLVLLGRSAGGQMVTATAYGRHNPGIRGVIAIYPPTDFYLTWESATHRGNLDHRLNLEMFLGGTPQSAGAAYESASGARLVTAGAPPTLILQGALDINVFQQQSELLDERLADAGVPHALVMLPWAAHAFDLANFQSPGGQIETYAVAWFLAAVTR